MHSVFARQVSQSINWMKKLLTDFLSTNVENDEVIFLAFNHRNKMKLKLGIWYTVNCLYYIYLNRSAEVVEMLENIRKLMFWHLTLERWIASRTVFHELYSLVRNDVQV